jgi:hypothetical protein
VFVDGHADVVTLRKTGDMVSPQVFNVPPNNSASNPVWKLHWRGKGSSWRYDNLDKPLVIKPWFNPILTFGKRLEVNP